MNGYIIVASCNKAYYESAHQLIDSLFDNDPDAKIALFTHKEWFEGDDRCDGLYLVKDCPKHKRAKLWALPQSPFDTTVYLDADAFVVHEDVTLMFDLKDNDMMFTNIRSYSGAIDKFIGGQMVLHGGAFTYDTKRCKKFLDEWWRLFQLQINNKWWPKGIEPKHRLNGWDQFPLWWLTENNYDDIKIGIYEDDARFNFIRNYKEDECEGEIVVWHYTIPRTYMALFNSESFQHERQII